MHPPTGTSADEANDPIVPAEPSPATAAPDAEVGSRASPHADALTSALAAELARIARQMDAHLASDDPLLRPRLARAARLAHRWLHTREADAPLRPAATSGADAPSQGPVGTFATEIGGEDPAAAALLDRNQRLRHENAALREELERRRRAWSYAVHELRNAADALSSWIYALRGSAARRESWYPALVRAAEAVLRRADDAFIAGESGAPPVPLETEPFDLCEAARAAVRQVAPSGDAHDIGITLATPSGSQPVMAQGNRDRVLQITGNLLRNAIAATPDGGMIVVTVRMRAGLAELLVEDSGAGVAENQRAALFEVRDLDSLRLSGQRGLGLPLSRMFAEQMGGSLDYQPARSGAGACFTLALPLATQ
ncbi:MAG: sensor histidine kinase [Longimicrobiales bacterium]